MWVVLCSCLRSYQLLPTLRGVMCFFLLAVFKCVCSLGKVLFFSLSLGSPVASMGSVSTARNIYFVQSKEIFQSDKLFERIFIYLFLSSSMFRSCIKFEADIQSLIGTFLNAFSSKLKWNYLPRGKEVVPETDSCKSSIWVPFNFYLTWKSPWYKEANEDNVVVYPWRQGVFFVRTGVKYEDMLLLREKENNHWYSNPLLWGIKSNCIINWWQPVQLVLQIEYLQEHKKPIQPFFQSPNHPFICQKAYRSCKNWGLEKQKPLLEELAFILCAF